MDMDSEFQERNSEQIAHISHHSVATMILEVNFIVS